jgi:hypothetical protein
MVLAPRLPLLRLALATALAGGAAAQEPSQEPQPVLRVQSRDPQLTRELALLLGAGFPGEPPAGECHQLVVRPDRSVGLSAAAEPAPHGAQAELFLDVPAALKVFEPDLGRLRRTWEPRVDAALRQAGYPPGFGKTLVQDAFALLPQVAELHVRIEGNLRPPARGGRTVSIDLVPGAETALVSWVRMLPPAARHALALPAALSRDAAATLQIALDPERLQAVIAPFARFSVDQGCTGPEERDQNQRDLERSLAVWDGAASAVWGGGSLQVFLGARDPAAYAALLADPERLQRQRESCRRRGIEMDVTPGALEHRGAVAIKTAVHSEADTRGLPSSMQSYAAVAGDLALVVGGTAPDPETMRAAIDLALDGGLERRPLDHAAVLQLDLDIARILAMLPAEAGGLDLGASAPRRVRLLVHKIGITLKVRLELR